MRIRLSWPDKALSPNARLHWAKLAKAKKFYRTLCWSDTLNQLGHPFLPEGPLLLELTFYRPTRRSYDRDNLLARMKAGIDGVADALHIDDKRFTTTVVRVAEELGNYVQVEISEDLK